MTIHTLNLAAFEASETGYNPLTTNVPYHIETTGYFNPLTTNVPYHIETSNAFAMQIN